MRLKAFWYIAAESKSLNGTKPLGIEILGQRLALFRNEQGRVTALEDRCLHRSAQLSQGQVANGRLVCPYHGWGYDGEGKVADIPSLCPSGKGLGHRQGKVFPVREKEGYIYVWLHPTQTPDREPFDIPCYGQPGYHHIRLINLFENDVTNCVENFVDIPHTVFVHPGIFRVRRNQRFTADVSREEGQVTVQYHNETANLGFASKFLNPSGREIVHSDRFIMPNITSVEYDIGPRRHFFITSQSIPIAERKTLVYTDLTYDYGIWNRLAAPFVRRSAQIIIDQDKVILENQNQNLLRYPDAFQNTGSDLIHVFIESIRAALQNDQDPLLLPSKKKEIEFWI